MKTNFYNYFYYTRAERNGAVLLCLLCLGCLTLPRLLKKAATQPESPDFKVQFAAYTPEETGVTSNTYSNATRELFAFNPNTVLKEDLVKLGLSPKLAQTILNYRGKGGHFRRKEDLLKIYGMRQADYERLKPYIELREAAKVERSSYTSYERKPAVLFKFDPNTATEADFVKLGLSDKTAATLVKFRSKGGTFRKKEDLKKIYSLKEQDYERLAAYIQIETAPPVENQKPIAFVNTSKSSDFIPFTKKTVILDINQATLEDWQSLKGIGVAYAKRIVNFREKLGGFSSVDQISETYGLPDSTFQQIKTNLKSSAVFRKIALNTATLDELKTHPYIDNRKAAAIISYREQHGKFNSLEELQQMKALPADWISKVKVYFVLD